MKQRNYNYDIMRIVACLMIICMHAPMPSEYANPLFLNATGYLMAPGLCIFFILSGALLLPVKTDTFIFLKKRLGKVVTPTLCFTALYMVLDFLNGAQSNWLQKICSIPFSNQGHGILWFMYTLIGLYFISPILSRWLERVSKRELEFYLMLWGVTLCFPLLSMFVETNLSNTGMLFYFSGYVGYFVLGHYLSKYPQALSLKVLALSTMIAIVAPVAFKVLHVDVDFYSVFWYLSIFVAILTVTLFRLFTFKSIMLVKGTIVERIITTTSGLSFGIYLVHIAIMRNWLWKQEWIMNIPNYYMQYIAIVVLTFTISFIVTYLISLLPFGDYIIGFKQKRK